MFYSLFPTVFQYCFGEELLLIIKLIHTYDYQYCCPTKDAVEGPIRSLGSGFDVCVLYDRLAQASMEKVDRLYEISPFGVQPLFNY